MKRLLSVVLLVGLLAAPGCDSGGDSSSPSGVPEEVVRYNIIGTSLLSQQKWDEAKTEIDKGLALRPDDPVLLVNMAVALLQQADEDGAEVYLRRALEQAPDDPYAHYNMGTIERNRGNLEAAAAHFAAVTETDSEDVSAVYNLASVLMRLRRHDEAESLYRRALELNPTHVSTLYGLGRLLLQTGRDEEGTELISISQEIRARSGVDDAMGTQYGEQGPYAMGVDYPAGGLAAPDPIPVTFEPLDEIGGAPADLPAWAVMPAGENGGAVVVHAADDAIRARRGTDDTVVAPLPADGAVGALAAGNVNEDAAMEIVALVRTGPGEVALATLAATDGGGMGWNETGTSIEVKATDHTAAVLVDRDHDGDLDLFACAGGGGGTTCFLADNDGAGNFAIPATDPRLLMGDPGGRFDLAFSDLDNDRDIDLIAASPTGVRLFLNLRDGTYLDGSEKWGLGSAAAGSGSIAIADLDKDSWMDVVVATAGGPKVFLNHRARFAPAEIQPAAGGDTAGPATVTVLDYDNDGFLDLAGNVDGTLRFFRNLGLRRWEETTSGLTGGSSWAVSPLVAADLDGDGATDVVAAAGSGPVTLGNRGAAANQWVEIVPEGVGDNRYGVGTKIEVMAGALRQKFEVSQPLPIHAGLGHREGVDAVRLLWPGGVIQDELKLASGPQPISQLDRKGTSCPLMYAWRDGRWRFVTDFLGGCAIGYRQGPGKLSVPDTDEYVKIEGGLTEQDGELRLRLNNQLEEVIWFDQAELVVVDHPAGTEVFPDEKLMPGPPWPEFRLFASADIRAIASARDVEGGRDVTALLAERDDRYVEGFPVLPHKGYAEMHTLEIDLGEIPPGSRTILLLDGWIDYADSTSNLSAWQAGADLIPPRLSAADGRGGWTHVTDRMGFPAGLPKTMTVDVSGIFPSADRRLRIATTMCIYWDRARVMVGGEKTPLEIRRIPARTADLRFGGFPEPLTTGRTPLGYDPDRVSMTPPWRTHAGAYTAFGDVRELISTIDDRFVTTRNGDEIDLRFEAPGAVAPGRVRTYLLYADGFGKDMDTNSAASDRVGPIPFHGMPVYPYGPEVRPPHDPLPGARIVTTADDGAVPLSSKLTP
jgi:Flp pilus assembly protein TadD